MKKSELKTNTTNKFQGHENNSTPTTSRDALNWMKVWIQRDKDLFITDYKNRLSVFKDDMKTCQRTPTEESTTSLLHGRGCYLFRQCFKSDKMILPPLANMKPFTKGPLSWTEIQSKKLEGFLLDDKKCTWMNKLMNYDTFTTFPIGIVIADYTTTPITFQKSMLLIDIN